MVKQGFHVDVPLVVLWDGKLMEELTTKHVDMLPIPVLEECVEKLTGVPELPGGGMGKNQASDQGVGKSEDGSQGTQLG